MAVCVCIIHGLFTLIQRTIIEKYELITTISTTIKLEDRGCNYNQKETMYINLTSLFPFPSKSIF